MCNLCLQYINFQQGEGGVGECGHRGEAVFTRERGNSVPEELATVEQVSVGK